MPQPRRSFSGLAPAECEALEARTRGFHHASREAKTHGNHNRFVRYYEELCQSRRVEAWPASAFNVGCFLVKYCEDLSSVQSLDNALSAIRTEAKENGQVFTDPDEWYLRRVRRGPPQGLPPSNRAEAAYDGGGPLPPGTPGGSGVHRGPAAAHARLPSARRLPPHQRGCRTALVRRPAGARQDGQVEAVSVKIRVSKARYESETETVRFPAYRLAGVSLCAARLLDIYMHDPRVLRAKRVIRRPSSFRCSLERGIRKGEAGLSAASGRGWHQSQPRGQLS